MVDFDPRLRRESRQTDIDFVNQFDVYRKRPRQWASSIPVIPTNGWALPKDVPSNLTVVGDSARETSCTHTPCRTHSISVRQNSSSVQNQDVVFLPSGIRESESYVWFRRFWRSVSQRRTGECSQEQSQVWKLPGLKGAVHKLEARKTKRLTNDTNGKYHKTNSKSSFVQVPSLTALECLT